MVDPFVKTKKCLCEDTKSSFLVGEEPGGTSAFHVPLSQITGFLFGLVLSNCSLIRLAKIDGSRGLVAQRLM
jgi:hypothetical protein